MKPHHWTALFLLGSSIAFGQGSLTPPGLPSPTMKTLDQVEPRIPISSAPYTISQSGSYYLTTNLTSSGHGIIITTSGVTLDLMGFTVNGDRGSADYGIFLDGATNNLIEQVVVKNGIVRDFGYGLRSAYSQGGRFEHLTADSNRSYGIYLHGRSGQCDGNMIANCTINGNGSYGIYLYGRSGQCDGNTITDCTITGNGNIGTYFNGQYGQCDGNTITDCTITGNGNIGTYFNGSWGRCNGNTITDCTINGNKDLGIKFYGYSGQCAGNAITDCIIHGNTDRGIYLNSSDANRIEGNHITGQIGASTSGILSSGSSENLIFRNTCVGQTNNFALGSGNVYGPIFTTAGELPTTGAGAHPLANFSF